MLTIVASVLVFSFFSVSLWCYFKWTYADHNELASKMKGPPSYPLIGSVLNYVGSPAQKMAYIIQVSNEYGAEPFKFWFGPFLSVILSKPEDVQVILCSPRALKRPFICKFFKAVGEGLMTANVDKWKIHRRIINPAFNTKLLQQFFSVFNDKSDTLVSNLKEELDKTVPFDLLDYMLPTTIDTICQTAMGYNLNTQSKNKSEFVKGLFMSQKYCCERVCNPLLYPNTINSAYEWLLGKTKLYKLVEKLPLEVIMEKKKVFENKIKTVDDQEEKKIKIFLDLLLDFDKEGGANFSVNDLKDEVLTMIAGGSETTAIVSCFCLLMLAIHQNVQDKVYDEIYNALGDSNEPILFEDVNKLSYLEQVVMETLRLYPLVPMIPRELEDDIKIFSGDFVLPKGTIVFLNAYGTHRNSEYFSDPSAFNPENFNRENITKRPNYSFIPFSRGQRNCIGHKYAMLSMKVLLCKFLQNFSVHTDIKMSDIKLSYKITIHSCIGYPVTIRSRDKRPAFKLEK